MDVQEDRWLSVRLGRRAFRVRCGEAEIDAAKFAAPGFYYAKVDTRTPDLVRRLGAFGFFVVDTNVHLTMELPVSVATGSRGDRIMVRDAGTSTGDALACLAERCFRYSRFHLDSRIPTPVADRIKRDWIVSYLERKRGDRLFEAVLDGEPVGFLAALACESEQGPGRAIDLMGVAPSHQRKEIGVRLVEHFIQEYNQRCNYVSVGTQIANTPSLRLYQKAGFRVSGAQYVLHAHL